MTPRSLALVVVAVALVTSACSSTYMADVPFELEACAWKQDDARRTSLAAVFQSLEENRWSMVQGSAEDGYLRAKACRHTTCATVDVFVDAGGNIQIYRYPRGEVSRNMAQLVESWMIKLEKRYERNRCEPSEESFQRVEELTLTRGFVPQKP